jgi:hypothetical protein
MPQPIPEEQLDQYAELAILADHDGIKVDPAVVTVLVDEVRRLQCQSRFLLRAIARRDAETGRGDDAVREFLAPAADGHPDTDLDEPDEPDEPDEEIPNPPYDPPHGTTWLQWHGG